MSYYLNKHWDDPLYLEFWTIDNMDFNQYYYNGEIANFLWYDNTVTYVLEREVCSINIQRGRHQALVKKFNDEI